MPSQQCLAPSSEMKAEVLESVNAYMARLRQRAQEHLTSPQVLWHQAWSEVLEQAALAAQEGFITCAAQSDDFVAALIEDFMAIHGRKPPAASADGQRMQVTLADVDPEAGITRDLVLKHYSMSSSPRREAMGQCEVELMWEWYDNDDDRLTFGDFVMMQFVPLYLGVQNMAFPTPVGVPREADIPEVWTNLSASIQTEVEIALAKYGEGLRQKVHTHQDIEIASRTSKMLHSMKRPETPAMEVLCLALVEAQLSFMSVLLCKSSPNAAVAAACEQWKAYEMGNFISFDKDANGELDAGELEACMEKSVRESLPAMQPEEHVDFRDMAQHFLNCFDIDNNGHISAAEWLVSCAAFHSTYLVSSFYAASPLPTKQPPLPVLPVDGTLPSSGSLTSGFQYPKLTSRRSSKMMSRTFSWNKERRPMHWALRLLALPILSGIVLVIMAKIMQQLAIPGVYSEDPGCRHRGLHLILAMILIWFVAVSRFIELGPYWTTPACVYLGIVSLCLLRAHGWRQESGPCAEGLTRLSNLLLRAEVLVLVVLPAAALLQRMCKR